MRTNQQCQIIYFFFLILISGFTADAAEVTFRQTSTCQSSFVTLGDIAEISDCDEETQGSLAAVRLMPAPGAGRKRVLGVREVQELLDLQGVDVLTIRFRGASRMEVKIAPNEAPRDVRPAESGSLVVTAVRPLRRGEIIRPGDVMLKQFHSKSPADERKRPLESVDDAIGMQSTRAVTVGQIIDANFLQRPMIVQRAGTVTVYARVGGIEVATKGRALADGALDDVVTVELLDDRDKRVAGRVVGLDEVEVFAQGAAMAPAEMRPLPVTRAKTSRPKDDPEDAQLTRKN